MSKLPFSFESDEERRIFDDPEWRAGIEWGAVRSGHPEGAVKWHIAEVLANVDRLGREGERRRLLRLAALAHDSFKHQVNRSAPRQAPNEHGFLAARWLERRLEETILLNLLELHDEGYRAWRARSGGRDEQAWARISRIIGVMGPAIELFMDFYWCDNNTGDKTQEQLGWFVEQLYSAGVEIAVPLPRS